jgi:hypothetical protein
LSDAMADSIWRMCDRLLRCDAWYRMIGRRQIFWDSLFIPAPSQHEKYYFSDGSIIILVSFYVFILGMQNDPSLSLSVWPYTL